MELEWFALPSPRQRRVQQVAGESSDFQVDITLLCRGLPCISVLNSVFAKAGLENCSSFSSASSHIVSKRHPVQMKVAAQILTLVSLSRLV